MPEVRTAPPVIPRQRTHLDNLLAPYTGGVPKRRDNALTAALLRARANRIVDNYITLAVRRG